MYNHRHYPLWNGQTTWMNLDAIKDSKGNLLAFPLLHAVMEGPADMEWYGVIQASLIVVNPLRLLYPDNTNSGLRDFFLPPDASEEQKTLLFQNTLKTTNFNPMLLDTYKQGIENICDLFSMISEPSSNYWFAGFSVPSIYQEGESASQCWQRINEEYGSFEFLIDSVKSGDINKSLSTAIQDAGLEIPQLDTNEKTNTGRLQNEITRLYKKWGPTLVQKVNNFCAEGLVHQCIQENDTSPQWRGNKTAEQMFVAKLEEAMHVQDRFKGKTELPRISHRSMENYKTLVRTFKGDSYSLVPTVNEEGEIVLNWRWGPQGTGEAVLQDDGTMFLDFGCLKETNQKLPPTFKEVKARIAFDAYDLSTFIETGKLPD